ncbi:hypothetical protein BGX27_000149 [Mortierella sp. AM989]|nr:hypothetical protein BGX27_000149 [Mortierella sp. AM989]
MQQNNNTAPSLARIVNMPELAHALQCYLEPKHLALACLHVKLVETSIHIKVLQSMLGSLAELRVLELDLPMEEFGDEEEQEEIGPNENALLKSIEIYSSPRLEHLELVFQTSVRIPVKALCSMLKCHPTLRTVKLVDADIEESISWESKNHRKGKKMTKKDRKSIRKTGNVAALTTSSWKSGSSTPASPYSVSSSEDETLTFSIPTSLEAESFDKGIKTLLTTCKELRILGMQASGMTTNIFEQPWACHGTLEQLDLQGVFKLFVPDTPSEDTNNSSHNNVGMSEFSAMKAWRDRQAKISAFEATRFRLKTLSRLKNLRLAVGEIGKEVLEGFGPQQQIEVLHLYGLQSSQVDKLPWGSIRARYPFLKQIYCGVIGVLKQEVKNELSRLNIELLASSTIPDLAFENNFDG